MVSFDFLNKHEEEQSLCIIDYYKLEYTTIIISKQECPWPKMIAIISIVIIQFSSSFTIAFESVRRAYPESFFHSISIALETAGQSPRIIYVAALPNSSPALYYSY
jgi:hypothetical protein